MTERPTAARLDSIRSAVHDALHDRECTGKLWADVGVDLLAEIDALRAERASLQALAALGAELLDEARTDVAFYERAGGMGAHCPSWPRPLAARIVKRSERLANPSKPSKG